MQIHILITLSARALLQEAGATTLDLDAAPGLLLNVLDIGTAMANNLRSEVKARNWLEINGNLLFGPFALYPHQHERLARMLNISYSAKLISLHLLWLSSTKSSLVNEVGEFLLHKLLDLLYSQLKAPLRRARNVEVKGRVLQSSAHCSQEMKRNLQQPWPCSCQDSNCLG